MVGVSKAHQILRSLKDLKEEPGPFLVCYTFKPRTSTQFYVNLKRIIDETGDGKRVQPSIVLFNTLKAALASWGLARDYGADVFFCTAQPVNPAPLWDMAMKK